MAAPASTDRNDRSPRDPQTVVGLEEEGRHQTSCEEVRTRSQVSHPYQVDKSFLVSGIRLYAAGTMEEAHAGYEIVRCASPGKIRPVAECSYEDNVTSRRHET